MDSKLCSGPCGATKPIPEFHKRLKSHDGVHSRCKSCRSVSRKIKYKEDPEYAQQAKKQAREWQDRNPEKCKENKARWNADNIDRVRLHRRNQLKRLSTDINFKLRTRLRIRLNNVLKGKPKRGSAIRDLGCSVEELIAHFEKQFKTGMTWENYGTHWQIDHIKRLADFDLGERSQLLEACNYTNLQPLCTKDHIEKTKAGK